MVADGMLGRLLSRVGYRLEVVRRPVRAQLDRSSRRRWRMHQLLVSQLSPETLKQWTPTIRRNLRQLRRDTRGEPHMSNLDRWQRLVSSGDVRGLRLVMTGLDTDSIQMHEQLEHARRDCPARRCHRRCCRGVVAIRGAAWQAADTAAPSGDPRFTG